VSLPVLLAWGLLVDSRPVAVVGAAVISGRGPESAESLVCRDNGGCTRPKQSREMDASARRRIIRYDMLVRALYVSPMTNVVCGYARRPVDFDVKGLSRIDAQARHTTMPSRYACANCVPRGRLLESCWCDIFISVSLLAGLSRSPQVLFAAENATMVLALPIPSHLSFLTTYPPR
jgi:hypothetical protein